MQNAVLRSYKAGLRYPAYWLRTRGERPMPVAICCVRNGIMSAIMVGTITRVKIVMCLTVITRQKGSLLFGGAYRVSGMYQIPA
jgi:hypothetical protein